MSSDFPNDLRYTKEHEWARPEGKGNIATVGITQYAVDQLGDITRVDLPKEGEMVQQGQELGTVDSVKAVSSIYSPVSGTVVKVNDPLADSPEMLNEDCYDEGWLVQIEMSDPGELDQLMTADKYEKYLEQQEEE
jgi:glycine cleavage system H protein